MYTHIVQFGEGPDDPNAVSLEVVFDWDRSPKGRIFLGILEIRHKGDNILELFSPDVIGVVSRYTSECMLRDPPSPARKALHDSDPEVLATRQKIPEYLAVMSDDSERIAEAARTSEYPCALLSLPRNPTQH